MTDLLSGQVFMYIGSLPATYRTCAPIACGGSR
jgi:hypothetical protein